ncbi:hypothetical protein BDV96DRAFT_651403 [Lophiotrema nucula]|uniref:F-box domain-containing protein n=1 Tax=Lophiotrema nucula TaxID=690887 RepID=A0A6A5YRW0_9PLEO|nr:hypothetical protein BDV96DRAFT_651403 [Lophiotrema nucula]
MTLLTDLNLESLTYTHADLRWNCFSLDRLLDRMAPVFSINDPTPRTRELGALTVLPTELLLDILENLSIIDLMRFRRCNRYSSYFVDTIPPLRTALRIAPNTVKGMMALQVSAHITANQLCQKLYQKECDGCGALAQCIYLPACLRACFRCTFLPFNGWFQCPQTEDRLVVEWMLRPEQLAARPSFRPLLGTFTNGMNKFKMVERHTMYDCPTKKLNEKLGWSPWYDARAKFEMDPDPSALTWGRIERQVAMWRQDPNREAVTVVRDPPPQGLLIHMALVVAPWPDSTSSEAEQGVFCSTCLGTVNQHKLYTEDMFLEHLRDCRVQPDALWASQSQRFRLWLCEDDE